MSVDKLISVISGAKGLAQSNRFRIVLPSRPTLGNLIPGGLPDISTAPGLSALPPIPPLPDISGFGGVADTAKWLLGKDTTLTVLCESVTLPGRNLNTGEATTHTNMKKFVYGFNDGEVTASFLLDNNSETIRYFNDWMGAIVNADKYITGWKADYGNKDIIIEQLGKDDDPIYTIKLLNAYPISSTGIDLGHANENQYSRFSVTFSYDHWESMINRPTKNTLTKLKDSFDDIREDPLQAVKDIF